MEKEENPIPFDKIAPIQWHPGYVSAIKMEFKDDKKDYFLGGALKVGNLPLEVDMIILKNEGAKESSSIIGRCFKRWNLLEFKSPGDELNIDTFVKGLAYVSLYKTSADRVDGYKLEEITYTFIRQEKPVKLMKRLAAEMGYHITSEYKGIYYVKRENILDFFFQIIVIRELNLEECIWLGVLQKGITKEGFRLFLESSGKLKDLDEQRNVDTINEVVIGANVELIRKWKEDADMSKAMEAIMEPEIQRRETKAREEMASEMAVKMAVKMLQKNEPLAKIREYTELATDRIIEIAKSIGVSVAAG